jgi:hypothetical protein
MNMIHRDAMIQQLLDLGIGPDGVLLAEFALSNAERLVEMTGSGKKIRLADCSLQKLSKVWAFPWEYRWWLL